MTSDTSIHGRIVAALRDGIRDGTCRSRLPSEMQIARRFFCTRKTAVRAMEQLAWEGLVVRRKGKGTFVSGECRRRRCTVGLIVMSYSEMFPSICRAISIRCQDDGHVLLLGQIVAVFTRKDIPVVLIDGDIAPVPARSCCDVVEIDNFEAGYRLARHVLERRPRGRVIFCTRPFGPHSSDLRWHGVRSATLDAGGNGLEKGRQICHDTCFCGRSLRLPLRWQDRC